MVAEAAGGPGTDIGPDVRRLVAEGAALYNSGAFWRAHEAWEEGWHLLKRAGHRDAAEVLKGLILMTAAFENRRRGKARGFRTQLRKGVERLTRYRGEGPALGIADAGGLAVALEGLLRRAEAHEPARGQDEPQEAAPRLETVD